MKRVLVCLACLGLAVPLWADELRKRGWKERMNRERLLEFFGHELRYALLAMNQEVLNLRQVLATEFGIEPRDDYAPTPEPPLRTRHPR